MAAAARHTVGVEPVWPAELHAKTSYSANDISDSVARVISVFCRSVFSLDASTHRYVTEGDIRCLITEIFLLRCRLLREQGYAISEAQQQ